MHKILWTPTDEFVRQTWTTSKDDGKTWNTAADLNYYRVTKTPEEPEKAPSAEK